MENNHKLKKGILIIVPLIGIAGFYYRQDGCYYEIYFVIFSLLIIFMGWLSSKANLSKLAKRLYLFSITIIWLSFAYYLYVYFTQFIQHYEPCIW